MENLEALTIGDFRIEKRIGAGGMGVVYQARQLSLDRVVALKVLGQALTSEKAIARFQREAQAAARLNHSGIASIYFVGQDDEICYMAIEFIDGMALRRVIDRLARTTVPDSSFDSVVQDKPEERQSKAVRFDEPTTPVKVTPEPVDQDEPLPALTAQAQQLISTSDYIRRGCAIIRNAGLALEHAHRQGVVHRDVKPENLMLDRDGHVHIIDFGIARFFEDATLTQTGQLVGTPMYMSPEQVTGRLELDPRTDIYSLGLVLHELLTLRPPITGPTRESILRHIVTKTMPPVSWQNRSIPESLEAIVHKAIAKDPDERYQTAADFAEDLANFLAGKPISASPYRYKFDQREILATRPRWVILFSFALFFIAIFGTVYSANLLRRPSMMDYPLLVRGLSLFITLAALFSGFGLLEGRSWARWVAIGIGCFFALLGASWLFGVLIIIARGEGGFPAPWWNYLPGLAGISVLTLGPAGVVWELLRRRTRDWFAFAARQRAEYKAHRAGRG